MSDNHLALVIRDLQKQLNEVRDSLQLQIDQLVVERDRSVCLLEEVRQMGQKFGRWSKSSADAPKVRQIEQNAPKVRHIEQSSADEPKVRQMEVQFGRWR